MEVVLYLLGLVVEFGDLWHVLILEEKQATTFV
jgi:hypothetical protein